jgi:hypothetical protein
MSSQRFVAQIGVQIAQAVGEDGAVSAVPTGSPLLRRVHQIDGVKPERFGNLFSGQQ